MSEPDFKKTKLNEDKSLLGDNLRLSSEFFTKFSRHYQACQPFVYSQSCSPEANTENNLYSKVITEPFLAGVISNVFQPKFLTKVRLEIENHQTYSKKFNDLYEFYQSKDLKATKLKQLKKLRDTLYGKEFIEFFSKLTGIELNNTLDASVSKYVYGNRLLCHDDNIQTVGEGRRIAFIVYLVDESWSESDGGALELFSRDCSGHPVHSNKLSILPKWNHMAFFEIGNHSYHQVAEVTAKCKDRLSIVGWFHGPLPTKKDPIINFPTIPFFSNANNNSLEQYINPDYLSNPSQMKIKESFRNKQFMIVELRSFLTDDFFESCLKEINSQTVNWGTARGPANVRNYYSAVELPTQVHILSQIMLSVQFKEFVESVTGILLDEARYELRKFNSRQYTLLHDEALEPSGLDAILSFSNVATWDSSWGGTIDYVKDSDRLASIDPLPNKLTLAIRPPGTNRFVNYVKSMTANSVLDLSFSYTLK